MDLALKVSVEYVLGGYRWFIPKSGFFVSLCSVRFLSVSLVGLLGEGLVFLRMERGLREGKVEVRRDSRPMAIFLDFSLFPWLVSYGFILVDTK